MSKIQDNTGDSWGLRVDKNHQAHAVAVTVTAIEDATHKGNSYNINTGEIALTTATESAVLYFKNDESPVNGESRIVIDSLFVGIDDEGTTTGASKITVVRNPTAGTIVSGATAVDMNQNRNFGSSNTLSATTLAYKGAEGNTLTGGDDIALIYQQPGTRGAYDLNLVLEKGSSIGIILDTDTSGGTTNVYAGLSLHRVDGNNI